MRRFTADYDVKEISRSVIEKALYYESPIDERQPVGLKAEALIRFALGERGLINGIDRKMASRLLVQRFSLLVENLELNEDQLDDLLVAVERGTA